MTVEIHEDERGFVRGRLERLGIGDNELGIKLVDFLETRRVPSVLAAQVFGLIENGDSTEALLLLTRNDHEVVSRSPKGEVRRVERVLGSGVAGSARLVLTEAPTAFPLGTAAHKIIEKLELGSSLDAVMMQNPIDIFTNDAGVVGVRLHERKKRGSQLELFSTQRDIDFEVPLEFPPNNQVTSDWVRKIIGDSFSTIGELPSKPYDVAQLFKDREKREALIRIVEVCHIVFGNLSSMSTVAKLENREMIGANSITEFQAINWLSIAQAVCLKDGTDYIGRNKGVVSEMSIGRIRLQLENQGEERPDSILVHGGEIDVLKIDLSNTEELNNPRGLPEVISSAEGEFRKQNRKYRRVDPDGKDRGGKLGRNLRSLLWLMRKEYGGGVLNNMKIEIIDYKFPCGDGGMWQVFNRDNLPIAKHIEQVSEYIFLTFCQLCVVYKKFLKGDLRPETEISVSIEEVVKFASEFGLVKNISAKLDYKIPGGSLTFNYAAENPQELLSWGKAFVDKKLRDFPDHRKRHILDTLVKVLDVGEVEIIRRIQNRPPSELAEWCHFYEGQNYLFLDKFLEWMVSNSKIQVLRAVKYSSDVVVVWLRHDEIDRELRLAINKNGRFRIAGFSDMAGGINGLISSTEVFKAVPEKPEEIWEKIDAILWKKLEQMLPVRNCLVENEWQKSNSLIGPDGRLYRRIEDKPIICTFDPMIGTWFVDNKLLLKAVEEMGERDPYGIRRLAIALGDTTLKQQNIMCPRPDHPNKNTEAATLHSDGHIHCYVCGTINTSKRYDGSVINPQEKIPTGDCLDHYRNVSPERHKAMVSFSSLAELFGLADNTLEKYLDSRGLRIDDMPGVGFIPLNVSRFLDRVCIQAKRMETETNEKLWGWKHIKNLTVPQFLSMVNDKNLKGFDWMLDKFKYGWFNGKNIPKVWGSFCLAEIAEWQRRGLIGQDKNGFDYFGGRVIVPTVWPSGDKLLFSNVNGRGIVLNGETLYEDKKHRKTFLGPSGGSKRPVPPGIWLPERDKFLTNVSDTILILEGAITAASFWKMIPGWRNKTIAGMGVPKYQLVAFLKWLGVEGYEPKNHASFGLRLKKVVLGMDFDWGGAKSYQDIKEVLEQNFSNLEILPVHEILKESKIVHYLRLYDQSLYLEDGPYSGMPKLDFNDILMDILGLKRI